MYLREMKKGTNKILVDRIFGLTDGVYNLNIYSYKEFKELVLKSSPQSIYIDNSKNRKKRYHVQRCRYFYDLFLQNKKVDPISIDAYCYGEHVTPYPVIDDGNHRLIAAKIAGIKTIKAYYGGRLDTLRYLQGKRKTLPEE